MLFRSGIGSTADVTDATDTLKASYTYDPWGKLLNPIDPLGTKDKFKFSGEALDLQTGLYYLRARYYDAAIGAFISKDRLSGSLWSPSSRNRYAYALGNPLALVDPSGFAATPGGDFSGGGVVHSGTIISGFLGGGLGFTGSGPGVLPSPGPAPPARQTGPPFTNTQPPPGDFPSGPYNDCDFEPCGSDSIFPGNALTPPGLFGWPFGDILTTPKPSSNTTCDIFDVCSAPDTQAPVTPGQIDTWNNTSDSGFDDSGGWDFSSAVSVEPGVDRFGSKDQPRPIVRAGLSHASTVALWGLNTSVGSSEIAADRLQRQVLYVGRISNGVPLHLFGEKLVVAAIIERGWSWSWRGQQAPKLKRNPSEWMPWNYRDTLARLARPAAA